MLTSSTIEACSPTDEISILALVPRVRVGSLTATDPGLDAQGVSDAAGGTDCWNRSIQVSRA